MKKAIGWLFLLALLVAGALAFYLWQQGPTYRAPPAAPADAPPPPAAARLPEIQFPVPEAQAESLPSLENSDSTSLGILAGLFGKSAAREFFQPQEIIRRMVVTIDNLPRKTVSGQLMPTRPPQGKLRVSGKGEDRVLSAANQERYAPFIMLLEAVDPGRLAQAYFKLYPLFQQAYRDLGYPRAYFNDRLVAVIDHMLEAPQVDGPVALVQPHVFYKFADPELEALSAGHKLMIRIGGENAARVKDRLRAIRAELAKGADAERR